MRSAIRIVSVAAAVAAGSVAFAGAASASGPFVPGVTASLSAPVTYRAVTLLTNRPDGGNGGTWAYDDITRVLTIKVNGTTGAYHDTATVTDTGIFTLVPNAPAPNQAVPGVRVVRHPRVLFTSISGTARYSFTSNVLPSSLPNMGVPPTENGAPVTPPQTTSDWYAQAFPSSAVVQQGGITTYAWTYDAGVIARGSLRFQRWTDSSANGDGDRPGDGNVTG